MEYKYPLVQYLSTYSVLGILLIFCCIIRILEQNIKFICFSIKFINKYLRSDSNASDPESNKIADGLMHIFQAVCISCKEDLLPDRNQVR